MTGGAGLAVGVCAAACLALLVAEYRDSSRGRAWSKIIASTAFVVLALQFGATTSDYGRWILAALALSWVGDVLLLSPKERLFLPGIGSFLLAHVAYALAFAQQPLGGAALALGCAALGVPGLAVLAWLWPHLTGSFRVAVAAYVVAIVVMGALAIAVDAAAGSGWVAGGALAFAISDVSVARDRFVTRAFVNRAWGLPLYYAAQLVLAATV